MKKLIIMFSTSIFITLSIQTFTSAYTLVSTQKVTIYVGDKKQLNTWKNNVKWSVSDKDCVSMSQTGRIQALKKGKTIITARHGNKKKKFIIIIKDSYLNIDFSDIAKIGVTNLANGYMVYLDKKDIINIEKLFNKRVFFRYNVAQKPKKGAHKYAIKLYDNYDKQIYNIAINEKEVAYDGGRYKSKKNIDLSFFDNLFSNTQNEDV